jgi:hypothetical protein
MNTPLFLRLNSTAMAHEISSAERAVCYAAPGILEQPARALAELASFLGPELITVCLDFDERVLRMGFGTLEAVKLLRNSGIEVRTTTGLRTGILIVDDGGFIFTPTALYLEPDEASTHAPNAMRLTRDQAQQALARLSPAAKMIAMAFAPTVAEKERIAEQAVEIASEVIPSKFVDEVSNSLEQAPPVQFDVARQVRVFTAYLQYVELKLTGAAIQRKRITLPSILHLGANKEIQDRLKTTFDLVEKDARFSSKLLDDELNNIRAVWTRVLGARHGRVVLKANRPHLEERLAELREKIEKHQEAAEAELQAALNRSCEQIIDFFVQPIVENPPDRMRGQVIRWDEAAARSWLASELTKVFPDASKLLGRIKLEERYKEMTIETLDDEHFLASVKAAYPLIDWDKAYHEYQAAGPARPPGE